MTIVVHDTLSSSYLIGRKWIYPTRKVIVTFLFSIPPSHQFISLQHSLHLNLFKPKTCHQSHSPFNQVFLLSSQVNSNLVLTFIFSLSSSLSPPSSPSLLCQTIHFSIRFSFFSPLSMKSLYSTPNVCGCLKS